MMDATSEMTEAEATKIYLEKYPLINECYSDLVWKNKNGWNFKRLYEANIYRDTDTIHHVQVRQDGSIYKNGIKIT